MILGVEGIRRNIKNYELISSDPACNSLGCRTLHYAGEGVDDFPVNYPVVHLGMDPDIKDTLNHADAAERELNLKWKGY